MSLQLILDHYRNEGERSHFIAPGRSSGSLWTRTGLGRLLFENLSDELAQVEGSRLHLELKVSARLAIGVSVASAIDIGHAVDDALDIHAFFRARLWPLQSG